MDGEYPVIGGPEQGYQFTFRNDGVFLVVYPTDSIMFELSDMRQILRECGVVDYDVALVSRAMREASGREQRIAEPVEISQEILDKIMNGETGLVNVAEEEYARLIVDITRDKMKVTIK